MKTFAFETKNGFRMDVKASNIKSAVNKIRSIPYLIGILTGYYYRYDNIGLHLVEAGWAGRVELGEVK